MSQPILVRSVRIGTTTELQTLRAEEHEPITNLVMASITASIAVNDTAVPLKGNPAALVNPGVYLHRDDVIAVLDQHFERLMADWGTAKRIEFDAVLQDIATRGTK